VDTLERYKTVIRYFEQYQGKGGQDERIDQYVKDARKGLDREERRRERERKDQLRQAEEQQKAKADATPAGDSGGTPSLGAVSQPGSAPLPPSPAPAPAGSGKLATDSQ
jgi:hypothetical protein